MTKTLPAILEDAFDLQVWNEEMLDEDGTEREFSEEDRQALIQLAEENALEFSKKAEGYGKALQMIEDETTVIEARIDALKAEVKRLESRKNTRDSNVNFMKSLLVHAMKITGTTKIKTPLFSFSIRKTKSLDASLANPDNLPPSFVRTKCEVDKTAINDALKAEQLAELSDGTLVYKGQVLTGVKRVEKESLSIR